MLYLCISLTCLWVHGFCHKRYLPYLKRVRNRGGTDFYKRGITDLCTYPSSYLPIKSFEKVRSKDSKGKSLTFYTPSRLSETTDNRRRTTDDFGGRVTTGISRVKCTPTISPRKKKRKKERNKKGKRREGTRGREEGKRGKGRGKGRGEERKREGRGEVKGGEEKRRERERKRDRRKERRKKKKFV